MYLLNDAIPLDVIMRLLTGLERIHVVGSMNPATTVGRHPLSARFTALTRVAFVTYPDDQDLHTIYSALIQPVLSQVRKRQPCQNTGTACQFFPPLMIQRRCGSDDTISIQHAVQSCTKPSTICLLSTRPPHICFKLRSLVFNG